MTSLFPENDHIVWLQMLEKSEILVYHPNAYASLSMQGLLP